MIESKRNKKSKDAENNRNESNKNVPAVDTTKMTRDNELMKKRNEQLMQILLEFENENKLLEKGLLEIRDQLVELNNKNLSGSKKMKSLKGGRDNIIKCPSLDKLLNVSLCLCSC